mgnify:FL=1
MLISNHAETGTNNVPISRAIQKSIGTTHPIGTLTYGHITPLFIKYPTTDSH